MTPRHRSFSRSLAYALAGVLYIWRTQGNMRIHLGAAVAVLALGRWLSLPRSDFVLLLLAVGLVVAVEALNTAVESTVDLATDSPHPIARRAKDVAAAAVLWTALVAVGVGAALLGPHLGRIPEAVGARWVEAPLEVAAAAVLAVGLVAGGLRR